jgi:hypothetical protein
MTAHHTKMSPIIDTSKYQHLKNEMNLAVLLLLLLFVAVTVSCQQEQQPQQPQTVETLSTDTLGCGSSYATVLAADGQRLCVPASRVTHISYTPPKKSSSKVYYVAATLDDSNTLACPKSYATALFADGAAICVKRTTVTHIGYKKPKKPTKPKTYYVAATLVAPKRLRGEENTLGYFIHIPHSVVHRTK